LSHGAASNPEPLRLFRKPGLRRVRRGPMFRNRCRHS
jgi:hypothetical protein